MLSLKELRSRSHLAIGIALVCFLGPGVAHTAPGMQRPITLATGPSDGAYHRLAEAVRNEAKTKIEITRTLNCAENLDLVETGRVRFAFAQQDVVGDYFRNHPETNLRVVDRIFFDYLHILLRESVHLDSMADLRQLRIWAGEEGTGTRFTASRFLDTIGMPLATLDDRLLSFEDLEARQSSPDPWIMERAMNRLPDWFQDQKVDAAILLATPVSQSVCRLMRQGRCSLVSLDRRTLRRLITEKKAAEDGVLRRQIAVGAIPAETYSQQVEQVTTIAVPVLLVARSGEDGILAGKLRDEVLSQWRKAATASGSCPLPEAPAAAEPLAASGLKMLPGVPPQEVRPLWPWSTLAMLGTGTLLLSGLILLLRKGYPIKRKCFHALRHAWLHYRVLCSISILMGVSVPLITAATYWVEHEINDNFSDVLESFWSITVYLFSGLEDRVPFTSQGRVFVTLGLLVGAVCSTIASAWVNRVVIRKEKRMPKKLKGHYVILNWNERGLEIVRELHHPVLKRHGRTWPIVVLTDDEGASLRQFSIASSDRDYTIEVYPRFGDPTDEAALREANVLDARAVIILADEKRGDERMIRSIVQLLKLARGSKRKDHHIIAEVIDASNASIVDELNRDFTGVLERVSLRKLRNCLLSQAALNEGITGFYEDLLSVDGGNEIYTEPIPSGAVGMSFRDYAIEVIKQSAGDSPIIPVGVQRRNGNKLELVTNPKDGKAGYELMKEDKLVVISYGPPARKGLPAPEAQRSPETNLGATAESVPLSRRDSTVPSQSTPPPIQ